MNEKIDITQQRAAPRSIWCLVFLLASGWHGALVGLVSLHTFDFGLVGDMPCGELDATNAFASLLVELNLSKLDFVVHDGDIKDGSPPCSDALLERRYDQFQTSRHPLILIFGDYEWTDCGRNKDESYEPLERLKKLREL